jgi:hypothetical protein
MAKTVLSLKCPKCHFPARAECDTFHKFIIYICPKCHSNVVFYDNKVDIISDRMVNSLKKKNKLKMCGNALFPISLNEKIPPVKSPPSEGITKDKILDLKILLETEKDIGSLLSKL